MESEYELYRRIGIAADKPSDIKLAKFLCSRCDATLDYNDPFCSACDTIIRWYSITKTDGVYEVRL